MIRELYTVEFPKEVMTYTVLGNKLLIQRPS